ncbi:ribose ABC transporter permease [Mesorhizobium sp. Root552]|uniref:ABC transporter permease n=1 Tax=Mesorhizobium sp. Root552 TaxID=1736555 RepID=UPI0006F25BCA|nr:ribose ABC transporter permease [Mesorhizobium sp. Root552]KQZ29158.1 ribose ABC transporter permease [Mesorhizobium sp. Root552]
MSDISTIEPRSNMQKLSASIFKASGLLWVFLGLCVVAALLSPAFLNPANLMNVFRQVALYGIVSVGMTFVILTKGIDLSVGSILGVCAVSTALLLSGGWSPWLAVIIALLIGTGLGAINGIGVAIGRVPPFIMTLGMMVMARGLALTLANGQPIGLKDAAANFAWLGRGAMLGIPVPVWIFAVVAGIAIFVLRYTPFGRQIYAVGSNEEAAHLSGISVNLINFSVYVISGFLAALTALIFVSRLTVGEPTAGTGIELEAIAITVIGGTSLFGGEGGIFGTIIGAAILAVLANIMNLVGISPFTQQIVKGAIIVGAVLYEMQRKRK